jgi:hypothetical protein
VSKNSEINLWVFIKYVFTFPITKFEIHLEKQKKKERNPTWIVSHKDKT